MSFVLDASVAIAWAFSDQSNTLARPALERVQSWFAIAPSLWQFEIASALRKASIEERLSLSQLEPYLADLSTLDIRCEREVPSIALLLHLASRFRLTTYDAAYLELAMRSPAPLATLDGNLIRAAQQANVPLLLTS